VAVSDQIQARIQAFATELEALVRQAALDAVTNALGAPSSPARVVRRDAIIGAAPRPAKSARSGGKRDPNVIAALTARVGAHVKSHPGQGVEAIAKALNVTTHDITLPVTKLLASKDIKKKGQKRATKYFPA
jgi:hypothetical protein